MDWSKFVIDILNTDAVVAGIAALLGWGIAKLIAAKPEFGKFYEKYKGVMIAAVKKAEKAIPDDTNNGGLRKLDNALKYAVKIIEAGEGRKLNSKEIAEVESNISEVHDELEKTV